MKTTTTRKLRPEILESRTMLTQGLDALAINPAAPTLDSNLAPCVAQFGDANADGLFDDADIVQVQQSAKYATGQPATFGEGDWNGDKVFDQHDIIAALQLGNYVKQSDEIHASCNTISWTKTLDPLTPGAVWKGTGTTDQGESVDIIAAQLASLYLAGPYAAIQSGGRSSDGQTSVVYVAGTGEVAVDAPAGEELTSINIDSSASIFTGEAAQSLGGSFDNHADNNIFKATFGSSFGSLTFGNAAQPGLSEQFVLGDLSVIGSLAGGGDLGNVDLVYVPEPTSVLLLSVGLAIGLVHFRRVYR